MPNPAPALTTPLATASPRARSTSRDSPVTTDSSSVAASSTVPSTGTTSPGPTSSRSATATRSSGTTSIAAAGRRAAGGTRSARQQRPQVAGRPALRVRLQRPPGRHHHRDHRPGQVLPDAERAGQRQHRDHVHAELPRATAERSIDHAAGTSAATVTAAQISSAASGRAGDPQRRADQHPDGRARQRRPRPPPPHAPARAGCSGTHSLGSAPTCASSQPVGGQLRTLGVSPGGRMWRRCRYLAGRA